MSTSTTLTRPSGAPVSVGPAFSLPPVSAPVIPEIRKAYLTIALFFGSFFLWAFFTHLPSAALAPAEVVFDGFRKQIQHVDGGIVRAIHVRDGDRVRAGDVLYELDDVSLRTRVDTTRAQLILDLARAARLEAEARKLPELTFSPWLTERARLPDVREAMQNQRDIFSTRGELNSEEDALLRLKIQQREQQQRGEKQRLGVMKQELELLRQEIRSHRRLVAEQLVTRAQLYALEGREQSMLADIATLESSIQQSAAAVAQLRSESNGQRIDTRKAAAIELETVRGSVVQLKQALAEAEEKRSRTLIRAPIDGIISDQTINVAGAVIGPGENLAQIVPTDGQMVISAKVQPKDRDAVSPGLPAEIRFSAFNQKTHRPLHGEVTLVSADIMASPDPSQPSWYKANVKLLEDPDDVFPHGSLHPGMEAEVLIVTGRRTVIQYLTEPLFGRINRAMIEE